MKDLHAERSSSTRLSALSLNPSAHQSLWSTRKYHGKLADAADVIVDGDYGPYWSAISEEDLQNIADEGIFVGVLPFSKPQ